MFEQKEKKRKRKYSFARKKKKRKIVDARFFPSPLPRISSLTVCTRPLRNRDVNVLLPVAQPAPSGGGGTEKAAERKTEPKRATWDQYGPISTNSRIHALLQQGAQGPEQALWACSVAAQRFPRWNRFSDTKVTFLKSYLESVDCRFYYF